MEINLTTKFKVGDVVEYKPHYEDELDNVVQTGKINRIPIIVLPNNEIIIYYRIDIDTIPESDIIRLVESKE